MKQLPRLRFALLVALVALGVWVRAIDVADRPLQVDEAESAINALTILEHGYPTDTYMGLPIYENTLSMPWPDSEEYEFRDSSYTEDGVAIYHAWLPLYSIALALNLGGIEPDPPGTVIQTRHGSESWAWRTMVPRLPSLVFSALFLLAMFGLGRAALGPAGGWTALVLACFTSALVNLGSPARYYSATLALSACAGYTLWQLKTRGSRRDYVLHGVAMTLLFHTHVLSCLVLGLLSLTTLPQLVRRPDFRNGALLCGGLFALGVVPWMLATGFPGDAGEIPKAWIALDLPGDLLAVSGQRTSHLLAILLGVAAVAGWGPREARRAIPLFLTWGVVAFFTFSFLIPLISYFPARMSMMLGVPRILLVSSVLVAAAVRFVPRHASWVAPSAALLLLLASGRLADFRKEHDLRMSAYPVFAGYFDGEEFEEDARLYTEPNQQLILQYVLGLPAQAIAPVRATFLDQYPGEIVFLRFPTFARGWDEDRVRSLAPDAVDPAALAEAARDFPARQALLDAGATLTGPPPPPLPPAVAQALAEDLAPPRRGWWTGVPAFFGFDVQDHDFAWKVFFYRFVDPVARSGAGANYAQRLRGSEATLLPGAAAAVHRAPIQPAPEDGR